MAAIALILRNFDSDKMLKLGFEDVETDLRLIGKDVFYVYMYSMDERVREYVPGNTQFFIHEKVDANHIVHDCGDDIDLFLW